MFKAFFRLWLVVFIPLFVLIFPNPFSPISLFNEYAEKTRYVKTYSGTFHLIEQAITASPHTSNMDFSALAEHFGYALSLQPISEAALTDAQAAQLGAGEFVFINSEPELLLKKLPESDQVITLALDLSEEEEILRASQGTLHLISEKFNRTPVADWDELITQLAPHFHFELSYLPRSAITLSSSAEKNLETNNLTWEASQEQHLTFYSELEQQQMLLVAKAVPISSVSPMIIVMILLMFIVVISLGMFLWVNPLWRDLTDLGNTASAFGKGELTLRAKLSKTSVIARLGEAFNTMAKRIEALVKNQRQLTNAIAHDLRTPLYRLRFAFEMLDDESLSKAEKLRYRQSVGKSIDDLDHLINQTLLLSRYSQTAELAHFTDCKLGQKIQQEIEFVRDEQDKISIDLKLQKGLEAQSFFVDSSAMIRVLNNLISNACRYARSKIQISLLHDETTQHYHLIVEDDGPGIDEKYWQQVFEPFTQLGNEQRDLNMGHGLGLAIVRQISQWHQGGCKLSRSHLRGAKFEIFWPVSFNQAYTRD